jgi:uncharacterized protein GlcG (DUF336 family)
MSDSIQPTDMTIGLARRLADAALSQAREIGVPMAVAVVDRGGNVVLAERMDDAQIVALPLAIDKAWTAVSCQAPTDDWASSTAPGGEDWGMTTALGGRIVVLPGGMPIRAAGKVIGGVGLSGGYGHQDRLCAEAAVEAMP